MPVNRTTGAAVIHMYKTRVGVRIAQVAHELAWVGRPGCLVALPRLSGQHEQPRQGATQENSGSAQDRRLHLLKTTPPEPPPPTLLLPCKSAAPPPAAGDCGSDTSTCASSLRSSAGSPQSGRRPRPRPAAPIATHVSGSCDKPPEPRSPCARTCAKWARRCCSGAQQINDPAALPAMAPYAPSLAMSPCAPEFVPSMAPPRLAPAHCLGLALAAKALGAVRPSRRTSRATLEPCSQERCYRHSPRASTCSSAPRRSYAERSMRGAPTRGTVALVRWTRRSRLHIGSVLDAQASDPGQVGATEQAFGERQESLAGLWSVLWVLGGEWSLEPQEVTDHWCRS